MLKKEVSSILFLTTLTIISLGFKKRVVRLVKLEHLTKMLKQTYVDNQTARVPIELVDPRKAMAADRETWLRVPDMSRDRLAYSTTVIPASITDKDILLIKT